MRKSRPYDGASGIKDSEKRILKIGRAVLAQNCLNRRAVGIETTREKTVNISEMKKTMRKSRPYDGASGIEDSWKKRVLKIGCAVLTQNRLNRKAVWILCLGLLCMLAY